MTNRYLESAKTTARKIRRSLVNKEDKRLIDDLIDDIDKGIFIDEQRIQEAKMIGLRNPSFDGDMIGWLDDDFDDDDPDEDEQGKSKK